MEILVSYVQFRRDTSLASPDKLNSQEEVLMNRRPILRALALSVITVVSLGIAGPAQAANGVCNVSQTPTGNLLVQPNGNLLETATNSSTSDCTAAELPYLSSFAKVENLNPLGTTSASKTTDGAGPGPVVATARLEVPVGRYGPQIRFTFITNFRTNTGATGRICQTATTNQLYQALSYSRC